VGLLCVVCGGCGGATTFVHRRASTARSTQTTGTLPLGAAALKANRTFPQDVVAKVTPSVAEVECGLRGVYRFAGSGFVTSRGLVTALHVIRTCLRSGIRTVRITLPYRPAEVETFNTAVLRTDPTHDVALLELRTAYGALVLKPATRPPYFDEPVALFGFPGGERTTPDDLVGAVLAVGVTVALTAPRGPPEVLRDAFGVNTVGVLPGDSGGPVVDSAGRVVGVIEGAAAAQGLMIATPASDYVALH
jgi:S1-C subfamily serine protease